MILVEDLIGRPYLPGRCIGAVREVLRRCFPSFKDYEIPDTHDEVAAWLADPPLRWQEIGRSIHAAGRDGDVIYGDHPVEAGGEGPYVVVLVDAVGRICFTASKSRDQHCRTLRSLQGVISVQRRSA